MGNMNISTVKTKAYTKKQRTMTNERHSKQTQSNPIPPTRTDANNFAAPGQLGAKARFNPLR